MTINHIGILFFILSQCFNLGRLTLDLKEYQNTFQNKPKYNNYMISKEKVMWKDASTSCKKKGLSLAYVNSFHEYIRFNNFLYAMKDFSELWIGGHRKSIGPHYLWENGKYVEFGFLHPFLSNTDRDSTDGDCLEVKYSAKFGWNKVDCEKLNKYICVGERGEPHEEVMKIDFPEQFERPNVETHEGGQNINKLEVTTEALTTTTITSPVYYDYDLDTLEELQWSPKPEDLMYDYDYNNPLSQEKWQ